jgi:hypothetical protein
LGESLARQSGAQYATIGTLTKCTHPTNTSFPKKITLNNDIPFGQGKELAVDIPIDPCGMHDIYIGNIICLTLDILGTDHVA